MSIWNVINLAGGLAMFIFGMNLMSDGLKLVAGSYLKKILEKLTQNRIIAMVHWTWYDECSNEAVSRRDLVPEFIAEVFQSDFVRCDWCYFHRYYSECISIRRCFADVGAQWCYGIPGCLSTGILHYARYEYWCECCTGTCFPWWTQRCQTCGFYRYFV